jgi:D-aminopeptidase
MEGTSHIDDFRELFPMYREYWASGRPKLTADLVAATKGLLSGGATEVWVINHHGAGDVDWPNLIQERLPEGARIADDWGKRAMREHVDAMFQVGAHARGGSPSYLSHTILPGFRLRYNGELLSESHWWAWTGNVPLLGIVGSEALGEERGSLADVPFLAVQRGTGRSHAEAIFGSPSETVAAIEAFAASAAKQQRGRPTMTPTGPIWLEASLQNGDDAAPAMANAGWARLSATEFAIESEAWRGEGERIDDGIWQAASAAFAPYVHWFEGLDASSQETALAFPAERLADTDAMLRRWSADRPPLWFDASETDRYWEGFAGP